MKQKILFFLLVLVAFVACKDDDDNGFDVPVEFRKISFDPVPGGALMRYRLPADLSIFGVRARYKDAYGRELVKEGTYLTDTLLLSGFAEARTGELVQLTFLDNNLKESAPIEMTFDTQDAATVALFDNLTVNPFWGGFNVTYTSPNIVEGTVHIFYVGTNPTTKEEDNILVGSFPILEGGDTLNFELKQALDELKVVVRTDDFEGNQVKMKIYEGIDALAMEMLSPDQFAFSYPSDLKIEDEPHEIGVKYLFDGKRKERIIEKIIKKAKDINSVLGLRGRMHSESVLLSISVLPKFRPCYAVMYFCTMGTLILTLIPIGLTRIKICLFARYGMPCTLLGARQKLRCTGRMRLIRK